MLKMPQKQYISLMLIVLLAFCTLQNAYGAFTIEDEKKMGKEIYDKLEKSNFLLHDKKLNDYVARLGNRILAHSDKASFDYTFTIFDSSGINAFATPGGYIYINKGLISVVENEAQLAGVLAHEIAHANARHVASMIDKSQKLNIAMLAGLIAGALLGGGGEASAALAAFSVAGATSLSLKYQREHEEEADRLGIMYLGNAGYYPAAMVEFLKIMKQYEFFSKTIPSYFLTHPGTDDRIFYLESLLQTAYKSSGGKPFIIGNIYRIQAEIIPSEKDIQARRGQLQEKLKKEPNNVDLLYAAALLENQQEQTNLALAYLQKALKLAPRDEDLLKNIGLSYIKTGNAAAAKPYLLQAAKIAPNDHQITMALGKTDFTLGDYANALNYLLKLENDPFADNEARYYIAMCHGRLNQQGEAHYYFGLYFKKEKKKESALFHFRKAREYFPEGTPREAAISSAIQELDAKTPRRPGKNNRR